MPAAIRIVRQDGGGTAVVVTSRNIEQGVVVDISPDFPTDGAWHTYKIQTLADSSDTYSTTVEQARIGATIIKR